MKKKKDPIIVKNNRTPDEKPRRKITKGCDRIRRIFPFLTRSRALNMKKSILEKRVFRRESKLIEPHKNIEHEMRNKKK